MRHLGLIAALGPTAADLEQIEDGLEGIRKSFNLDTAAFERWRAALRGQP